MWGILHKGVIHESSSVIYGCTLLPAPSHKLPLLYHAPTSVHATYCTLFPPSFAPHAPPHTYVLLPMCDEVYFCVKLFPHIRAFLFYLFIYIFQPRLLAKNVELWPIILNSLSSCEELDIVFNVKEEGELE